LFANVASAQGVDCVNATSLTINGACDNGTISDVTQNLPNISGCSAGTFRREGWYTFTVAGGSLDVTITGVTTNRNLFLQLISSTGSCAGLSQINCANNDNANNSAQTEVISTTLSNGIYYIKVVNAGNNNNMALSSVCVTAIPTISSFTPDNGCSSSASVVITGTNFTGVTAVRFGATNALSYVVNSSTQITAIPALGSTGAISVVNAGGTATSVGSFTVNSTSAAPTVGTITQPTCAIATASVALNGLPSGAWALTRTPGNVTTTGTGTSTTILGLAAGTTYTYSVDTANNGTGLKAEYFNNRTLTGPPTLTRTDARVDFDWVNGSPNASITNDDFSVRWTGFVQPLYSETYTFTTRSDDGVRLWVNGVQLINNWTDHGATNDSGSITLTAGVKYSIILEYYENAGQAVSQLSWSSPSQTSQFISTTQLFPYGSCPSPSSANIVINAQPSMPTIAAISTPAVLCSGGSLNPTNPTVTANGSTVTASGWQLETTVGGGAYSNITIPYTLALADNGKRIRYYATNGCGTTYSNLVVLSVNGAPTITPNKVDETCPSSNNGTISPTFSGGLSNVRYIKLTQKYVNADAWQQVAEIEAYEIFTGTNVARSTNGATATASSFYTTSGPFPPAQAIDGNNSGSNNFWHSGSPNINESITVDLASGKNIDYLIIYNRSDCCQSRGQNMLLELFDASNTLVYSRTIDLWQGGASMPVNVNVLDVSWADGATTLNRTGLDSGTYTLNCADAVGCLVSSPIVISSSATNNTWNGTVWSQGTPPTTNGTQNLVFDGSFTATTSDLAGCSCTVNSGRNVTINSGRNLIVTEGVTVSGTGTLTFENSASLVQINNAAVNTGNITYKRIAPSVRNTDYTYWSSPVSPLNLAGVGGISYSPPSLAGSIFYSYLVTVTAEDWKSETAATPMSTGLGYSIRAAGAISTNPPSFLVASFTGVPNNGLYSVAIAKSGASYLLGNPYPSAIDADKFISENSTVIDGTLYFWTHNTPIAIGTPDPGTGVWAYSGNDYATYTLSGGVGTSGNFNDINGNGVMDTGEEVVSNRPTGKIAAGQGFFTTSTAAGGNVNFTNAMRVDPSSNPLNNSNFYKTKNPKAKTTTTTIEKNRVWLNLTNKEGAFKQTLVGYITGATNTWDKLYDGESFDGNDFLDFYSINEDKNLTIQGRALPFDSSDEIPLGYRIEVEGNFTISIDETDGLLSNQEVFLEDKTTNKTVNLKEGNYSFNTAAGTFNDRFVLRYSNKTLGTTDFDVKENSVLVSIKNKQIKINSFVDTIEKVTIFDLLGRQIYQKDKINSNEFLLADLRASHETLIVKTSLQNGKTVSEKIIF